MNCTCMCVFERMESSLSFIIRTDTIRNNRQPSCPTHLKKYRMRDHIVHVHKAVLNEIKLQ